MINTPMLFCGLCLAPNPDGLAKCTICGTSTMMRSYTVRITLEMRVNSFTDSEALERAVAMANGDIVEYIDGMDVVASDFDNEDYND